MNAATLPQYHQVIVNVPRMEMKKFKAIIKALGFTIEKKCELDEAIADVEAGRVSKAFCSTEELFSHLGI